MSAHLIHSPLAYRALLRNLHILRGMRGGAETFRVVIAGPTAAHAAAVMRNQEPGCLEVMLIENIDALALPAGSADCLIVCQPYHCLRDADQLGAVRSCLNDQDGSLGLIWNRCTSKQPWVQRFVERTAVEPADGLLPPLHDSESAMSWVERNLPSENYDFMRLKHRKSIETVTAHRGGVHGLAEVLRVASDVRQCTADSWAAGLDEAAALAGGDGSGPIAVELDLHSFWTYTTPRGSGTGGFGMR